MAGRKTPVMQQHAAAKRLHPDAIVFFRLGDFYEMFEDDAVVCARLLDLTLTSRNKGKPDEVPMAGVPHHAAHAYIKKLLDLGHKVAVCEQMADPATVKGIVPREVVRILTPGTVTDREHLEAATNNWLCGVDIASDAVGMAVLDVSTGELRAALVGDLASAMAELSRANAREVLVGEARSADRGGATSEYSLAPATMDLDAAIAALGATVRGALRRDDDLNDAAAADLLGALASDAVHLAPAARRAAARALRYARACNPGADIPVRRIIEWDPATTLLIDPVTQRHLELVESMSGSRETTLLGAIDLTETPAAARLLRRRLLSPLTDVARIRRRLDLVELFVEHPRLRADLRACLREVGDLERLGVRAALGEATPRDLGALRDGLGAARHAVDVLDAIESASEREVLGIASARPDTVDDVENELATALVDRPPVQQKEGAIFRAGYDSELDELTSLKQNGAERMVDLEARLKAATDIGTLKVRYTRVFGWYVEISRSHAARAPKEWRRKQTVANGERFTLPELDDLADRITMAEERHRARELALFDDLLARVKAQSARVAELASRLARWDVGAALAEVAHRYDYRRPDVEDSSGLSLVDARHPVVERLAAAGRFVPNDVRLDTDGERLWVVTGPNMAGKSTLLRQTALVVILAQMGSYVPARSARIGLVDRVLSRVGASDNLARGESTFMVEMRETAEILRRATRRSLVILDEIGRGTSTFDGLAIAWAVAEYLDEVVGCRTLFATHYHELTALAESSEHAANVSVTAQEVDGDVIFLHRLMRGSASRSYGVAVAKLAGLPESVLARARALLESLEQGRGAPGPQSRKATSTSQLDLFSGQRQPNPAHQEVLDTLRAVDVERMTPLEALQLIARLKSRV